MRVRVRVPPPQTPPHDCTDVSTAPGLHPVSPAHVLHAPHPPHAHVASHARVRDWVPDPHRPHATVSPSSVPGVQPLAVEQAPHSPHAAHVHDGEHVRVRARCSAQLPQLCASDSIAPAVHSPSPTHVNASHTHVSRHVRRCVPHAPQGPPLSSAPGLHSPAPAHVPSFTHVPASPQRCICVPHRSHAIARVSPGMHEQSAGASHGSHVPMTHRSTPVAHSLEQVRCARVPIVGSMSSQSAPEANPSPSASVNDGTHTPRRHASPGAQSVSTAHSPLSIAASRAGSSSSPHAKTPSSSAASSGRANDRVTGRCYSTRADRM